MRSARVPVSVLLPHELFHALATADCELVFNSVMYGNLQPQDIERFWQHVRTLPPWKDHPALVGGVDLSRLVGFTFHADGAQMFRNSEYFVYSVSSVFGASGMVSDCLLHKFPILLIPERDTDEQVHWKQRSIFRCEFREEFEPSHFDL